jgi:16S rRNA (uracil1498-N3)-methyltransferase
MEWFVEKAVEIGVQEISFTINENSERKDIKRSRIQKIAVSSMKQSLKAYLPKINKIAPIKDFLSQCTNPEKYIGHLNNGDKSLLINTAEPKQKYCVLIGPEGDFTPDEIKESKDYGFQPISLGDSRLRTETAGIAACHILNIINEK